MPGPCSGVAQLEAGTALRGGRRLDHAVALHGPGCASAFSPAVMPPYGGLDVRAIERPVVVAQGGGGCSTAFPWVVQEIEPPSPIIVEETEAPAPDNARKMQTLDRARSPTWSSH